MAPFYPGGENFLKTPGSLFLKKILKSGWYLAPPGFIFFFMTHRDGEAQASS